MKERYKLLLMLMIFAVCWFLPTDNERFMGAVSESLDLIKWYAREHVILCLIPALLIAGAISVFVSQGAVMKYLGPAAKKWVAYPVAAVSGTILAVCSCTVLPLFASIYKRGAGLGAASAFLYSGPAINVLAIVLTARVLGAELGIARAVGAVVFSILIGFFMHAFFRKSEANRDMPAPVMLSDGEQHRGLFQNGLYFAVMIGILVFANWGKPATEDSGVWSAIYHAKWMVSGMLLLTLVGMLIRWFQKDELEDWLDSTWMFAKQMLPLLLIGVAAAGLLLGGPNSTDKGVIPAHWISQAVGGNSLSANFVASFVGAFMYFATLTEVPILEGLLNAGMGKGPALALLLAGPALSLPNMLVIRSVMGTSRTIVFVLLVISLSTVAGILFGAVV